MPKVTITKTFNIGKLVTLSGRRGLKTNMPMCWCIGHVASPIAEFYTLPAGGQSYIPLTHDSEINVGESVNIINLQLLTLTRESDQDIMRVKYDRNTVKEQSYMNRQKQLHAKAYEKWTEDDDQLLLQSFVSTFRPHLVQAESRQDSAKLL